MNEKMAKDLIELVNGLKKLPKSKKVYYKQKGKDGKDFKIDFDYVPLDDILEKIKESEKWALLQPISEENGIPMINNILIHMDGEKIESGGFPLLIPSGATMQNMGAIITYTRRYSLGAFLGIATETDNDANPESEVKDVKATASQIKYIENLYTEEQIATMLGNLKKKTLAELTVQEASTMIEARKK